MVSLDLVPPISLSSYNGRMKWTGFSYLIASLLSMILLLF